KSVVRSASYDPRRPVCHPVQRTSSPLLLHDGLEVRRTIHVIPYNGLPVRCRCTTDWKSVVRSASSRASYDLRRPVRRPVQRTSSPLPLLHDGLEVRRTICAVRSASYDLRPHQADKTG
ncbi:MAG: hypothetical protein ACKPEY_01030, partial [Planctomycetota bacterium]